MKRRALLKSMLTLPAAGLLGGCMHRFIKEPFRPVTSGNKLAIVLQGPFGLVIRTDKDCRVNAFVPKTDPDDLQHEFRFLSPQTPTIDCQAGYRFELVGDGLTAKGQEPHIDRAFHDIHFAVREWNPRYEDYFVSLELPTPDVISYVPPLHPALFKDGTLGYVPLNQVLEYRVPSAGDVRLHSKPLPQCSGKTEKGRKSETEVLDNQGKNERELRDYPPLSSDKLKAEYEAQHQNVPDQSADPAFSQRRYILELLSQYDYVFFLGVGVRPEMDPLSHMRERTDHGVRFFNTKLLPAIFQHPNPERHPNRDHPNRELIPRPLEKIGREALPCAAEQFGPSPRLTSAVWRPNQVQPHLQYVASNENCSACGANATSC